MFLMSRQWVADQIEMLSKKPREDLEESERIMLSQLQREQVFLDMLVLDYDNLVGKIEEVKERADDCEIRVLPKGKYEQLQRDSEKLCKVRLTLEEDEGSISRQWR